MTFRHIEMPRAKDDRESRQNDGDDGRRIGHEGQRLQCIGNQRFGIIGEQGFQTIGNRF